MARKDVARVADMPAPICVGCKHFNGNAEAPKCRAYPQGIPLPIWHSAVDHRTPQHGDDGVTYEPNGPADAEYAAFLFGPSSEPHAGPQDAAPDGEDAGEDGQ